MPERLGNQTCQNSPSRARGLCASGTSAATNYYLSMAFERVKRPVGTHGPASWLDGTLWVVPEHAGIVSLFKRATWSD